MGVHQKGLNMKVVVIVVVVLAIGIVSLGFYRGWFTFSSNKADEKSNVTLTVDQDKFTKDKDAALDKVQDLGGKASDAMAGSDEKLAEGTLVSVLDGELTMTDKDGTEQKRPLATDVTVTCDAETCATADLRAGMRIRLTTENEAPYTATRIEALDKNVDFEKAG
jgi:hypothetical protein